MNAADQIASVFRKYDANGDGKISHAELRRALREEGVREYKDEELDALFSAADGSGDRTVDFEEFKSWFAKARTSWKRKNGFLAAGNDLATNISRAAAEDFVKNNPIAMGYCYKETNPDSCWVKKMRTGFTPADGWKASILTVEAMSGRSAKRAETEKWVTKAGYLAGGNDLAAGLSRKDAEAFARDNLSAMGFCFRNSDPSHCWVKAHGTGFSPGEGWTTVVLDWQSLSRRKQIEKGLRHNVVEGGKNVSETSVAPRCEVGAAFESRCLNIRYTADDICGFRVCIDRCADSPALRAQLQADLKEMVRLWPSPAVELLRQRSGVWVNKSTCYPDGDDRRGAFAHHGSGWPVSKGDIKEKGLCAEICRVDDYLGWASCQPAMLLHELSHCYHFLKFQDINAMVKKTYEDAMASGKYKTGENAGNVQRGKAPYGATNHFEYFAETSEAFWSSRRFYNDFFPYVHAELRGFDPEAYAMQERAWGVDGAKLPSRLEVPAPWLNRLSKVLKADCKSSFAALDKDGSKTLGRKEFMKAMVNLGLGEEERQAAVAFADVNGDGVISYEEYVGFLTSQVGGFVGKRGASCDQPPAR
eukprot:CAMPEP_0117498714 /NCGR_PEP_ID=MMETSP0784-20121206/21859_1 /TAXON_ID=39447 /ORGANISM="" /LENGTH=587 /DNA_ID=CAMNT_0005293813 /DNA_START=112 /DNA_END=1875 /DNA_ORIENTATION=+